MNGIIRKRLLALFSAAGLVGSTASATAQVVKDDEANKTKTESKIKSNKSQQENNAAKGQATIKGEKANAPADAASKDAIKLNKANSEKTASQDVIRHKDQKSGTDAANVKQKSTIKLTNAASEKKATQNDANKKANQATPK